MKHLGNTALTIAAVAALTISALAQQSNATPDKSMPGCHKDMQSMMEKNTQTTKDIEAAKVSWNARRFLYQLRSDKTGNKRSVRWHEARSIRRSRL